MDECACGSRCVHVIGSVFVVVAALLFALLGEYEQTSCSELRGAGSAIASVRMPTRKADHAHDSLPGSGLGVHADWCAR
jgi:hypothetical protein